MDLRLIRQLFTARDIRNLILGAAVVLGGVALAGLTLFAHYSNNAYLAGIAAGISMIFVVLILFFVVPPLARNASREASQLNLPFEFTAGGAIMLGLIVIVGFSAWNTGNNLLFLVLSFLIASMLVAFAAGTICLKKLDVKMRFPETIFAGEETKIIVSIHNRKRLFPSFSVVVEVRGREREESVTAGELRAMLPAFIAERLARAPIIKRVLDHFAYLPHNAVTEHIVPHTFAYRGRLVIKDFELSTRFPFAFYRHRRRLPARETELFVLARIEPVSSEIDEWPINSGLLAANKRGSGQDLLALRSYQANDDLRRIDWKATARSRDLIVREFASEDERRITIFFDPRMDGKDLSGMTVREKLNAEQQGKPVLTSERFENGVTLAASLLSHFLEEQFETRLVIGSEAGEYGFGSRHLIECLKRLAVVEPDLRPRASDVFEPNDGLLAKNDENSRNFVVSAVPNGNIALRIGQKANFFPY